MTPDELNLKALEASIEREDFKVVPAKTIPVDIVVGPYIVPRIKRKHQIKIYAAVAPMFSSNMELTQESLLAIVNDPMFEDTVIAALLGLSVDTLDEIDYITYKEIYTAFLELNPNFLFDLVNEMSAKAYMLYVAGLLSEQEV